ncbi:LOW QUALITY PROTEIN: uncharacterized protein ACR2FA_004882 [Aphomia sociella]
MRNSGLVLFACAGLLLLMGLVTVAMLILSMGLSSITGLSRAVREPSTLNASMLRAMAFDNLDPSIKSAFSAMQLERGEHCDVPLYTNGCLRPALAELRRYVNALSILASAIVVVMGVTLFTTAYILVTNVVERSEARAFKPAEPLRIACLAAPPLVSFTSPAILIPHRCLY